MCYIHILTPCEGNHYALHKHVLIEKQEKGRTKLLKFMQITYKFTTSTNLKLLSHFRSLHKKASFKTHFLHCEFKRYKNFTLMMVYFH